MSNTIAIFAGVYLIGSIVTMICSAVSGAPLSLSLFRAAIWPWWMICGESLD